jgi:hypothetical protein
MKQQGVSIVTCHHCGHDHSTGVCLELVYLPNQDPYDGRDICGCHKWEPVLTPFTGIPAKDATPKAKHEGWLVALAWILLIGFLLYGLNARANANGRGERLPLEFHRLSPSTLSITCTNGGDPTGVTVKDVLVISCTEFKSNH